MFSHAMKKASYKKFAALATISVASTYAIDSRIAYAAPNDLKDESFCLYLSPESRANLAGHVDKNGIKSPVNFNENKINVQGRDVVIKAKMNDMDSYVYSPLYGERAAFRLKRIFTTSEGEIVGSGRVSNMTGELFDEEYEASVILKSNTAATADSEAVGRRAFLQDLPTRFYQNVPLPATTADGASEWKGTVPKSSVLDKTYAKTPAVSMRSLSKLEQIVIDGKVCSSNHAEAEEGVCNFDRTTVPSQAVPDVKTATVSNNRTVNIQKHKNGGDLQRRRNEQQLIEEPQSDSSNNSSSGSSSSGSGKDKEKEESCPVCRYMKAGPCKDAFIAWDTCIQTLKEGEEVQKCYQVTATMMSCMQGQEYYDPMTSNQQRAQ